MQDRPSNPSWKKVEKPMEFEKGKANFLSHYYPYTQGLFFFNDTTGSELLIYNLENGKSIIYIDRAPQEAGEEADAHFQKESDFLFDKDAETRVYTHQTNSIPPYPCSLACMSSDKVSLLEFINIIDKHLPLPGIKTDILSLLGLQEKVAEEVRVQEINEENISAIIKTALDDQKEKKYAAVWELANTLLHHEKELIPIQEIFELFEKIDPESPHFAAAQYELASMLMGQPPSEEENENIERMEQAFFYALQSGETNQVLIDQIYNELCGYKDLSVQNLNIKGDYNTLIHMAKQVRFLLKQNDLLQTRLSELEKKEISHNKMKPADIKKPSKQDNVQPNFRSRLWEERKNLESSASGEKTKADVESVSKKSKNL